MSIQTDISFLLSDSRKHFKSSKKHEKFIENILRTSFSTSNKHLATIVQSLRSSGSIVPPTPPLPNQGQQPGNNNPRGGSRSGSGSKVAGFISRVTGLGAKDLTAIGILYKLADAIRQLDKLQIESLKLGTNLSNVYKSSQQMFNDLPISIEQGIGIKLELLNEGIFRNTKETFNLGARMKATGQDIRGLAQLEANTLVLGRMTQAQTGELIKSIEEGSLKYNVAAEKIVGSLNSLQMALTPFNIMGQGAETAKVFERLLEEAGPARGIVEDVLKRLDTEEGQRTAMMYDAENLAKIYSRDSNTKYLGYMGLINSLKSELNATGQMVAGQGAMTGRILAQQLRARGLDQFATIQGIDFGRKEARLAAEGAAGKDSRYARSITQTKERFFDNFFQRLGMTALEPVNAMGSTQFTNGMNRDNMNSINGMNSSENSRYNRETTSNTRRTADILEKVYKGIILGNGLPSEPKK